MAEHNEIDIFIKARVASERDSIKVPHGLKEDVWQQIEHVQGRKSRFSMKIPSLAMAACLVLLLPILYIPVHNHWVETGKGVHSKKVNEVSPIIKTNPSNAQATDHANPVFQTSLTLPNGKVIQLHQTVAWKDLSIQLLVTSLPPANVSEGYRMVIGNHSTILSHETIDASVGKVTLALNKRTPPAASSSSKPTYEYWAITDGSEYAYAIDGTVVGDLSKAKEEIKQLISRWKVPK